MQPLVTRATAHSRIHDFFAGQILQGGIEIGQQLPTESEIARQFGVSRATVQTAMSRLALEGWIERFPGKGTFAKFRNEMHSINIDVHNIRSFEDDAAIKGDSVTYRMLSFGRAKAARHVAGKLGISRGASIFFLERLRLVDGKCIGFEKRYFSPDLTLNIDTAALDTAPTHRLIEGHLRLKIGRIDAALRAVTANRAEAEHLGIKIGAPLLMRSHTIFSDKGDVILYGDSGYVEPFAFRYSAQISD